MASTNTKEACWSQGLESVLAGQAVQLIGSASSTQKKNTQGLKLKLKVKVEIISSWEENLQLQMEAHT